MRQAYIVIAEHPDDESAQRRIYTRAQNELSALVLVQSYLDAGEGRESGYRVIGIDWAGTTAERESAALRQGAGK
jgi:hypothetical protein